jgi:mRNA interferase RelE/StbE
LVWRIEFETAAKKELSKLDKQAARRILTFLRERVAPLDNLRNLGGALKGPQFGEFWKYRIGDFRVVARIEDSLLLILIVRVGDRKDVHRQR